MTAKPIPRGEFADIQNALMRAGSPEDPCGRCGCRRKHHLPTRTFSYATSGASSGKSHELPTLAPTCCNCKFCFCFCVGFVEPFAGQRFAQCIYEPGEVFDAIRKTEGDILAALAVPEEMLSGEAESNRASCESSCPRCGSRAIDGICQNYGCEHVGHFEPGPGPAPVTAKPKRTKKPNDEQPRLFA
jgi:hypothetical protein